MQNRPQFQLRRRSLFALALALACCAPQIVSAQSAQTVRLVVGYAAGGPVDSVARLFATALSRNWGPQ